MSREFEQLSIPVVVGGMRNHPVHVLQERGFGDKRDVVVIVPGFAMSQPELLQYRQVVENLGDEMGVMIVNLGVPAKSGSVKQPREARIYGMEYQAMILSRVIESIPAMADGRGVLCGHSMGGLAVGQLGELPNNIHRLLLAPAMGIQMDRFGQLEKPLVTIASLFDRVAMRSRPYRAIASWGIETFAVAVLTQYADTFGFPVDQVERLAKTVARQNPQILLTQGRQFMAGMAEELAGAVSPSGATVVIFDGDRLVDNEAIGNGWGEVLPLEGSHIVDFENPRLMAGIIMAALGEK